MALSSRWIEKWNPEDAAFWQATGKYVARRNLFWSILAENLGFSVWLIWSAAAPKLPRMGFHYTTDQLFTLVAIPGLVGALVRFPYTFAVPRFGGRNWTIVSALLLLIPTILFSVLVQHPHTPFWVMAMVAATAGLGGGNFASSMTNISFFYPDREKGFALGLNAAGGNIGVSTVQLVVPLIVGWAALGRLSGGSPTPGVYLQNAGLMWLPLIVIATAGAALFMDNLSTARSNFRDQVVVAGRKHTWIMSALYIGTFGSFVGYSAAFPLLLKTQFPAATANLAFLGALVGSVARPLGGLLADKLGGTRVTLWNFGFMLAAALGVGHAIEVRSFPAFLALFLVLFVTTGIGNGSTFRMIPVIFRSQALQEAGEGREERDRALARARRESAAVLGFSSAIGALGGYFIPRAFGASIKATGGAQAAMSCFVAYYAICFASTWWHYRRRSFLARLLPSLAQADA
jgi:MFS transporter, NNP family, nitrate/nitrite transporter